jgi:hypothetical protein
MPPRDHNSIESIPRELDRYLDGFYARKCWRASLGYEPHAGRWLLEIRLTDATLRNDDRFFSLLEHFVRTQRHLVRQTSGDIFLCSLLDADGRDMTARQHSRGSSFLDDAEKAPAMRRRLTILGVRRRFWTALLPGAFLWAAAFALMLGVFHFTVQLALLITMAALALQLLVVRVASSRGR